MILAIRQFGDPVLRQKSQTIENIDRNLKKLVSNMADTMYDASGLGLAAVQVGVLQQVIITDISGEGINLRALINPVITDMSGETIEEEGCLSVSDLRALIKRAKTIQVKGIDLKIGEEITFEAEDWHARAIQHEIDHINGKLFFDKASEEERIKIMKQLTLGKT